jgi:hypothetical protein
MKTEKSESLNRLTHQVDSVCPEWNTSDQSLPLPNERDVAWNRAGQPEIETRSVRRSSRTDRRNIRLHSERF